MAVHQVELRRPGQRMGDVQRFPHPPIHRRIVGITTRAHAVEAGRRDRVQGREQRHIDATRRQALGQQSSHPFPRPVVTRRRPPRHRPEQRYPHENDRWSRRSATIMRSRMVIRPLLARPNSYRSPGAASSPYACPSAHGCDSPPSSGGARAGTRSRGTTITSPADAPIRTPEGKPSPRDAHTLAAVDVRC